MWDPSRWWRHSLDEQSRSQSSIDDASGSGSDSPEPSFPSSAAAGRCLILTGRIESSLWCIACSQICTPSVQVGTSVPATSGYVKLPHTSNKGQFNSCLLCCAATRLGQPRLHAEDENSSTLGVNALTGDTRGSPGAGAVEFFDPSYSVWPGEVRRPPPPGRPAPRVVQPGTCNLFRTRLGLTL